MLLVSFCGLPNKHEAKSIHSFGSTENLYTYSTKVSIIHFLAFASAISKCDTSNIFV